MIPGKVEFIVELRNPTMEPMDQVIASVLEEHAELTGEAYIRQELTQCSPKLMELGERLCRGRGKAVPKPSSVPGAFPHRPLRRRHCVRLSRIAPTRSAATPTAPARPQQR